MESYNFKAIEKKWQDKWEETGAFHAETNSKKPKFYTMIEFPYPSGAGLHVGHPRSYTALDIIARKRRMEGYNVLYPIGWDAFGLPTENFAIKNKVHPKIVTAKNIANFTRQLKMLGFSFDWSREINTTDPSYYKWTQWIFLQLFKHGLAYKQEMPINWCTGCKVGLSNEEVVNGVCERCGSEVVQKRKSQWMLKITEYAQRLIDDLDDVNYLEKIKTQQKNWIGRSEGAEVKFKLSTGDEMIVYTTRADTLFGATYTVMSPEHPLIEKMKDSITNYDEVLAYKTEAAKKSEFERTELAKEKTGVKLEGIYAVNPANGAKLPVFISDYVLVTYGTGAIMAVPAHDSRDWDFAKKFNLPIIEVVSGGKNVQEEAYTDVYKGNMVNSEFLNGLPVKEAIPTMIEWLEKQGLGKRKVNFKLRDWVFSRQRYWGEPIPLVHCDKCGWVPIPESELPLELPEIETFEPGENGESPLAKAYDWIETTCPCCGGKAQSLSGPGHGGNFLIANTYLEGSYSEVYPNISQNEEGMKKMFKQFSFPCGVPSHCAPETPGSINEGGELGYSIAHGFGAVLDNPDLIATVVVGDGEAETGPLATSWQSNKFLNPITDGAVLPILHLNGYKISNPTIFSRISHEEVENFFKGCGWKPYFVEGDDPMTMHRKMAETMDACIEEIKAIQKNARENNDPTRPFWPMIVLRTPKGWTGPKVVDGLQIEGSFRAHQVPLSMESPEHLDLLKEWLESYHAEELFDEKGRLIPELAELAPKGDARLGANPHANCGLLLKDLRLPDFRSYGIEVEPGKTKAQDMIELGGYIRDIFKLNEDSKNFRIFGPDESMSNRLYKVFEEQKRDWQADLLDTDDCLARDGRIMDGMLSEHMCSMG